VPGWTWVTRERVKVDHVAYPWLIRKFIDKDAEFLFVPEDKVMEVARQSSQPGSATRLTAISPATSAPPIVLAAMAISNTSSTSNNFALFVPVRRPSLPHRSWPIEVIGNASKPRGS
jgi:Chromate resistance exported protein